MLLLQFVGFASMAGLALSQCTADLRCASPAYPYGPFGDASGPLIMEGATDGYTCDVASGKLIIDGTDVLTKLSNRYCMPVPEQTADTCVFQMDGVMYLTLSEPAVIKCPDGAKTMWLTSVELTSLSCTVGGGGGFLMTYANGTTRRNAGEPELRCEEKPTTTSTTTTTTARPTTTTKKPDSPASASQLWSVNYYYNYGVGVHAFCADQTCINAIQSNGIGYDMVNGKGLLGRAVSESMINSVRASCPTGSANLRNLGFTKSGNKYLHNLSGTGLKCGWVAISNGACGARVQIKRWKSRYTDDMMYGVDLEWNTWYQGMVQEGGKVQFFMWD